MGFLDLNLVFRMSLIVLVYSFCQTDYKAVNIYLVLLLIVFLIGNYFGTMKDICK